MNSKKQQYLYLALDLDVAAKLEVECIKLSQHVGRVRTRNKN